MHIAGIWRYPVKSMQGEQLAQANIGPTGIRGDRHWCVQDHGTDKALTARREPALLFASARVIEGSDPTEDRVEITLPDGQRLIGSGTSGAGGEDDSEMNEKLSDWIGRPVSLHLAGAGEVGTYETQADETETGDWFAWSGPVGSFHDSTRTRVSIVSTRTMRDWEPRRFRINLTLGGIEDISDGTDEDALVGTSITIGTVGLHVQKQIDRCVVTTRPQPGGIDRDLSVLKTINAERDGFLGIGCLVLTPGRLAVGDVVSSGSTHAAVT